MRHPIGSTKNGLAVYVDLVRSQAAAHVARHPGLLGLVKELVGQVKVTSEEIRLEQDMGRSLGYSSVVETTEKDTILYAQCLNDEAYTRFVKNGKPLSTQFLTIILRRDPEGGYELYDAWLGRLNPPRPGSGDETVHSRPYWANHAFVLDSQPLRLRTLTKVCPY